MVRDIRDLKFNVLFVFQQQPNVTVSPLNYVLPEDLDVNVFYVHVHVYYTVYVVVQFQPVTMPDNLKLGGSRTSDITG